MRMEQRVPNRFGRLEEIPAYWAEHSPNSTALLDDNRFISYAELNHAIAEAAGILSDAGVVAGHRVMLVAENCIAAVCFLFAAAKLGAALVLVNARLAGNEVDGIAQHCEPQAELYFETGFGDAGSHASRRGASALSFPMQERIFVKVPPRSAIAEPANNDVAAIIYTSGTTGTPKGVMLTHTSLLFVAETLVAYRGMSPADRSYGVLPISHAMGLTSVLVSTLAAGASVRLRARFNVEVLLNDLETMRVTMFQGAQAMYSTLLQHVYKREPGFQGHHLRYIYAGGSPLDPTLKEEVEEIFGLPLHNGYGMTESSPTICHSLFGEWRKDSSVGPCLPGLAIRIVDNDGNTLGTDEAGELWVSGPNLMKGYFRDPAATAVAMQDGWLRTGDIATRDSNGNVYLVGRIKDIIIRSGFNVYPAEVEAALNAHPAIEQSAVVGRVVALNEEVVAFVQLRPGSRLATSDILSFLKDRISPYKRPSEIVYLNALPLMANGKIKRAELKVMAQKKPIEAAPQLPASGK